MLETVDVGTQKLNLYEERSAGAEAVAQLRELAATLEGGARDAVLDDPTSAAGERIGFAKS